MVYHCAADVRHFAPEDELLKTNVTGTKRAIEFAREARASYMHISTVSVAGEYTAGCAAGKAIFEEQDLDVGQNWMENPYAKSKMLAEYEVTKVRKRGWRPEYSVAEWYAILTQGSSRKIRKAMHITG